jgi:FkbM family methyltransferase
MSDPFDGIRPITFVDIGCSGSLDPKWSELFPVLSYIGFDPNAEECERLNKAPHPYQSARYLPYALAGKQGMRTLYKTQSMYCYSLLRPVPQWVNRFVWSDLFQETGKEPVTCTTLDALAEEQGLQADIIKVDSQGLDLEILEAGGKLLESTFCVETEPGLVAQQYEGENSFAQTDEFLRGKGFLLFDIKIFRVPRKNFLAQKGKHQPIYCEAVYLFDYVGAGKPPTAEQALKALRIAKVLGCYDYGYELAAFFNASGLIDADTLSYLQKQENWIPRRRPPSSRVGKLVRWLPEGIRRRLLFGLEQTVDKE